MEKQNKRSGKTIVTSVSVSEEFQKIIDQYNLSPTECFRRGVAVTLYDLGVAMYQSDKNAERSKYMQEFLKNLDNDEELQKKFEQITLFEEINKHLNKINEITNEIENGKEKA